MKTHPLRPLALLAAMLLAMLPAGAQQLSVKGVATDGKTGAPVAFASAQLLVGDSTLYALALADEQGRFAVETDSAATYRLRLSGVGFDSVERSVTLTADTPMLNLGKIKLTPNAIRLGEATATGKATNLTIRKDTFVYSAKTMLLDAGSTLSAMISQMPGVTMDDEGNLMWQGKKVESLLVNGKRFFGGDIKTALQNLPAEMVENLKLYDKKSDLAERTGIDDGERSTVMDVGIKKEYQGSWQGNLDAGGGYEDKWTGRLFVSRFSDRLQIGLSGLANNLNGDARVDQNGNWYNSGFRLGWSTLRNTALSLNWNNKDDKRARGYQEVEASVRFNHDNTDMRSDTWQENYLPGESAVWWNQRSRNLSMNEGLSVNAAYSANIDTLNFFNFGINYNRYRQRTELRQTSATMNDDPQDHFAGHPLDHVIGDNLPPETAALLVNTMDETQLTKSNSDEVSLTTSYRHTFRHTQNQLGAGMSYNFSHPRSDEGILYDARYYTGGFRHEPERQFNPARRKHHWTWGSLQYTHHLGKQLWWNLSYLFYYDQDKRLEEYYRLETLPGWADLALHPISERPQRLDTLAHLLDDNTKYTSTFSREHQFTTSLSGTAGKWQVNLRLPATVKNEALYYDRPGVLTTSRHRRCTFFQPSAYLKYNFNDRTSLSGSYSGNNSAPLLLSLLPVTDDNNPQSSSEGNPDLKNSWNNYYYLNFNTFFEKSQTSLYAYASAGNTRNAQTRRMEYDETTGYYHNKTVNVDGNWYASGGSGITATLDSEKRWTLNLSASASHSVNHGYLSLGSDGAQLNAITNDSQYANLGLSYRRDKLYAKVSAMVNPQQYRASLQPESDENGVVFSYDLNLSYTAPWGTTLGSDFMVYSRRGFLTENYNNDQYIWNAHIAQTFLKDKSLTLKLEATDILDKRTSDLHSASAYANYTAHYNSYERFVVLHVIYKFTLGKKKS